MTDAVSEQSESNANINTLEEADFESIVAPTADPDEALERFGVVQRMVNKVRKDDGAIYFSLMAFAVSTLLIEAFVGIFNLPKPNFYPVLCVVSGIIAGWWKERQNRRSYNKRREQKRQKVYDWPLSKKREVIMKAYNNAIDKELTRVVGKDSEFSQVLKEAEETVNGLEGKVEKAKGALKVADKETVVEQRKKLLEHYQEQLAEAKEQKQRLENAKKEVKEQANACRKAVAKLDGVYIERVLTKERDISEEKIAQLKADAETAANYVRKRMSRFAGALQKATELLKLGSKAFNEVATEDTFETIDAELSATSVRSKGQITGKTRVPA